MYRTRQSWIGEKQATCEVMTSVVFRVGYLILYDKCREKSGVVDVYDELLRMI